MIRKGIILSLLLAKSFLSFCQLDTVNLHMKGFGVWGTKGYAPHWAVSNRYGIFNENSNDLLLMPGFDVPVHFKKHWKMDVGFDEVIKYKLDESFIYQAYINISYDKLKVIAGKQNFISGQYSEDLSSGSFFVSNNALPIPRIGIGFYDYVDVPFTDGYLQVKGMLNHGWLEDNRLNHDRYNKPLLHEKFAYIRTCKIPINPFIGLSHLALYGGEDSLGNKVNIDYKAVFFGKSSSKTGPLSSSGEHLGLFDIGAYFKIRDYDFTYYYQKPITTKESYNRNFSRNNDFFTGILIKNPGQKIISEFNYEFISTINQSGEGIHDPYVNNRLINTHSESDLLYLKQYYGNLGYPVSDLDTEREWIAFLEAYTNYGYEFGGRVDYYNNYLYTDVYHDRIIGSSLMLTKPEVKRMTGVNDTGLFIVNNRIIAHHIGLKGYIKENFNYRILITYTKNKGAWQEYGGRLKWDGIAKDPDFYWFWKGDKVQWYTLIETNYTPKNLPGFTFKVGFAYDFGDLDNNFGGILGVTYNYSLKI